MVNCLGTRRCGGMVDTRDLKSLGRKTVPVRVGSPAPNECIHLSVKSVVKSVQKVNIHADFLNSIQT